MEGCHCSFDFLSTSKSIVKLYILHKWQVCIYMHQETSWCQDKTKFMDKNVHAMALGDVSKDKHLKQINGEWNYITFCSIYPPNLVGCDFSWSTQTSFSYVTSLKKVSLASLSWIFKFNALKHVHHFLFVRWPHNHNLVQTVVSIYIFMVGKIWIVHHLL